MIAERFPQLQELDLDEKMLLASELWNEVSVASEEQTLTPGLIKAIEDRIRYNSTQPVSTTEEMIARVRARHA